MLSIDKILEEQDEYAKNLREGIKENFIFELEVDIQDGNYEEATSKVMKRLGLEISIEYLKHNLHFEDDNQPRDIYKVEFKKDGKEYIFNFGQSLMLSEGGEAPTNYDVVACLTKNDPEDFDTFCDNFGYDKEEEEEENTVSWAKNLGSQRVYNAVINEWENVCRLFSEDELEILREIA